MFKHPARSSTGSKRSINVTKQQKPDGVEFLDPCNRDDVEGVLALQMQSFPMPDDTGLRQELLRHYFYTDLVRDGLVRCVLARKDGKIISYFAYTPKPNTYQKEGRRKHLLHIYWITLRCLVCRPNRIMNFRKLLRRHSGESQGKRPSVYADGMADALFLATARHLGKWVPPGGDSRVTVRVFEEAVKDMARLGVKEIFMTVRSTNVPCIRFCQKLGCYRVDEVLTTNGEPWTHFYYRVCSIPPG